MKIQILLTDFHGFLIILVERLYVNFRYFKKIMVGKNEKLFLAYS